MEKHNGYSCIDSRACPARWCWNPGTYQHRGACGSNGSRNTGATTKMCMTNAYRGCPDPLPDTGETRVAYYDRIEDGGAK